MGSVIQREKTRFRQPHPAGLKIVVTLRFLATWDSYNSLMYGFSVVFNTTSLFVPEESEAIYQVYKYGDLKCPSTLSRMA